MNMASILYSASEKSIEKMLLSLMKDRDRFLEFGFFCLFDNEEWN